MKNKNISVVIIEDDPRLNEMLMLFFEDQDLIVHSFFNCTSGFEFIQKNKPDFMLLDQQLPDGLGIDLVNKIKQVSPQTEIVMMTAKHDLELAIEAIKRGAIDFLHKPIQQDELDELVLKLVKRQQKTQSVPTIETQPNALIGKSKAMLKVSKQIGLCASSHANVLISGETGTGKEVVARLIHRYSGKKGDFIALNCAAVVDNLIESELFGHEKGAFTDALKQKLGKFELAQEGTLFLDEIAELNLSIQAKLLRVIQEREFERVGGVKTLITDARLIAATHQDLALSVKSGLFREDLHYRLDVINIHLPPLRERLEDIPLLVFALIDKITLKMNLKKAAIDKTAMQALQQYDWPGNVRELENKLIQALIKARGRLITIEHLMLSKIRSKTKNNGNTPILCSLQQMEAKHIQAILNYCIGHKGKSCQILAISRPALDRKIQKYQLKVPIK